MGEHAHLTGHNLVHGRHRAVRRRSGQDARRHHRHCRSSGGHTGEGSRRGLVRRLGVRGLRGTGGDRGADLSPVGMFSSSTRSSDRRLVRWKTMRGGGRPDRGPGRVRRDQEAGDRLAHQLGPSTGDEKGRSADSSTPRPVRSTPAAAHSGSRSMRSPTR